MNKPTKLDLEAADILEQTIIKGHYDPEYRNSRYMCSVLLGLWERNIITHEQCRYTIARVLESLQGKTTIFSVLLEQGLVEHHCQYFEWRIHGSSYILRLIRKLRGQPALRVE